jgi:hypothetical protein
VGRIDEMQPVRFYAKISSPAVARVFVPLCNSAWDSSSPFYCVGTDTLPTRRLASQHRSDISFEQGTRFLPGYCAETAPSALTASLGGQ